MASLKSLAFVAVIACTCPHLAGNRTSDGQLSLPIHPLPFYSCFQYFGNPHCRNTLQKPVSALDFIYRRSAAPRFSVKLLMANAVSSPVLPDFVFSRAANISRKRRSSGTPAPHAKPKLSFCCNSIRIVVSCTQGCANTLLRTA